MNTGLTPFVVPVPQWGGKVVWVLSDEKFAIQVGKGSKGSYRSKYVLSGLHRAHFYYSCLNLGPGYKARILQLSNKKVIAKKKGGGKP